MSDIILSVENKPVIPKTEKVYRVGTLSYNKRGLIILFCWLLWGDFCYTLMETVGPSILPIKLKDLGSSNLIIALIMSTLPSILNLTICPWVSFRSDRYRGRLGRRIPFILWTLPFLTMFLIMLGYSEQIGGYIHNLAFAKNGWFSTTTVTVFLIGLFVVGFQFFNMFVGSVYTYLFNDVVPQQLIGRFLGLFRVVSGLAGVLFNYFIFKYARTHMTEIFTGIALLYFFGFGLMCLLVREGQYPPPPEYVDKRQGVFAGLKTYFVECFSLRFYWYMFGVYTFMGVIGCGAMFMSFFLLDVGLTLGDIGRLGAYGGGVALCLTYPAGILADKYHPLRIQLTMLGIMLLFSPLYLIFLFVKMSPHAAYYYIMVVSLACVSSNTLYGASDLPAIMRIFPKERFGQFCSARAMICAVGVISGGLIAGLLFDGLKRCYGGSDFAYRWIPAWIWLCQVLAFLCLLNGYREWKRYGGMENYTAPLPGQKPAVPDVAITELAR